MGPWSRFREIKAALDREDIEGLLALHSPPDEYDGEASLIESEIAKITSFCEKAVDAGEVEGIIAAVWNVQFGPFDAEDLERRRSAFSAVAQKIVAGL